MGSQVKFNIKNYICEMSNKLKRYDIQDLMSVVILPEQVIHIYEHNRMFSDILEPKNKQTLTTH